MTRIDADDAAHHRKRADPRAGIDQPSRNRRLQGNEAEVLADRRLLIAPLAVGVALAGLGSISGTELLDTGRPGLGGARAFALLGTFLLVAAAGTAELYADARRIETSDVDWAPDPWRYIVTGAIVLLSYRAFQLLAGAQTVDQPMLYLLGNFTVALALSSVVVGPLFLLQRWRYLGDD